MGAVVLAAAGSIFAKSDYNPLQQYATVVSVEPRSTRRARRAQVLRRRGDAGASAKPRVRARLRRNLRSLRLRRPAKPADAAKRQRPTPDRACVVYDTSSVQSGCDVTYELDGIQKVVRMDRNPGTAFRSRMANSS